MNLDHFGINPQPAPKIDADTQARITSMVQAGCQTDGVKFACLKGFSFGRLTEAQRSALLDLVQVANHLGSSTGDKAWGRVARMLWKACHKWQTK